MHSVSFGLGSSLRAALLVTCALVQSKPLRFHIHFPVVMSHKIVVPDISEDGTDLRMHKAK